MIETPINVVRLADVAAQPWKNGGGVTRELFAWPNAQNWVVRLSIAEIERDGPFSAFLGVTRYFAVLSGAGVFLEDVGALRQGDAPVRFEGDEPRECRLLDGPTRDLNLMIRRDVGHGMLQRCESHGDILIAYGAAVHGVFDANECELRWAAGGRGLDVDASGSKSPQQFHFAFWTKEALQ